MSWVQDHSTTGAGFAAGAVVKAEPQKLGQHAQTCLCGETDKTTYNTGKQSAAADTEHVHNHTHTHTILWLQSSLCTESTLYI